MINSCRESPLHRSYLTSTFCTSQLEEKDGKMTSAYCNQRWCNVCNAIRTAKLMSFYGPQLKKFSEPYMVVLSRPNVEGPQLKAEIDKYILAVQRIIKHINKYFDKVHGMRKIECTYNLVKNSYHPHFHIVVNGKAVAEKLLERWLIEMPTAINEKGNKIQPCYNGIKKDKRTGQPVLDANGQPVEVPWYMELFKYFTKLTCKTNQKVKVMKNGKESFKYLETDIPAKALDTMLQALSGRRVFQTQGGLLKTMDENVKVDEAVITETSETRTWNYESVLMDWIDPLTGECLTGYKPKHFNVELTPSNIGFYSRQYNEVLHHLKSNDIKSFNKHKHVYMVIDGKGMAQIMRKKRRLRKTKSEIIDNIIQLVTETT